MSRSAVKKRILSGNQIVCIYMLLGNNYRIYSLGLNSIIDLSNNNSSSPISQKSLFTDEAWQKLKHHVYISRKMDPLPSSIERKLKKIEEVHYLLREIIGLSNVM